MIILVFIKFEKMLAFDPEETGLKILSAGLLLSIPPFFVPFFIQTRQGNNIRLSNF